MARDVTDTTPIESRTQLVEWIEKGSKPPASYLIGTEHEKFPFYHKDLAPVPYAGERGIGAILAGMEQSLGWEPILDGDHVIGQRVQRGLDFGACAFGEFVSAYGQGVFPEPFRVDDSDLEVNEIRLDWLHTKASNQYSDIAAAEIEKGFGLLTLELKAFYERDASAGVVSGLAWVAGVIDLITAAVAEHHGAVVLHYDADFEHIAAVTSQPHTWVAPRGGLA